MERTAKTTTVAVNDVRVGDDFYVNNFLKWQPIVGITEHDISRTFHWDDDWVQKSRDVQVRVKR